MRITTRRRKRRFHSRRGRVYRTEPAARVRSVLRYGAEHVDKFVAALMALLCSLALLYFWTSYDFYVLELQVEGNRLLSYTEIYRAYQEACKIRENDVFSVFYVEPGAVEELLRKKPEVKEVEVKSVLPARVRVRLVERVPVLEWRSGGERFWVDAEGVIMRAREHDLRLPVVIDEDQTPRRPGEEIPLEIVRTAVRLNSAVAELVPEWDGLLHYSLAKGFSFVAPPGYRVYMGLGEEKLGEKLEMYEAVVHHLAQKGITPQFIDVRAPEAPVFME